MNYRYTGSAIGPSLLISQSEYSVLDPKMQKDYKATEDAVDDSYDDSDDGYDDEEDEEDDDDDEDEPDDHHLETEKCHAVMVEQLRHHMKDGNISAMEVIVNRDIKEGLITGAPHSPNERRKQLLEIMNSPDRDKIMDGLPLLSNDPTAQSRHERKKELQFIQEKLNEQMPLPSSYRRPIAEARLNARQNLHRMRREERGQ